MCAVSFLLFLSLFIHFHVIVYVRLSSVQIKSPLFGFVCVKKVYRHRIRHVVNHFVVLTFYKATNSMGIAQKSDNSNLYRMHTWDKMCIRPLVNTIRRFSNSSIQQFRYFPLNLRKRSQSVAKIKAFFLGQTKPYTKYINKKKKTFKSTPVSFLKVVER